LCTFGHPGRTLTNNIINVATNVEPSKLTPIEFPALAENIVKSLPISNIMIPLIEKEPVVNMVPLTNTNNVPEESSLKIEPEIVKQESKISIVPEIVKQESPLKIEPEMVKQESKISIVPEIVKQESKISIVPEMVTMSFPPKELILAGEKQKDSTVEETTITVTLPSGIKMVIKTSDPVILTNFIKSLST
jgi:hypothetical protein